jgi:hypothetical protein
MSIFYERILLKLIFKSQTGRALNEFVWIRIGTIVKMAMNFQVS